MASLIYTFRPNLVLETMWGITRGHQMNTPTDQELYNNSLLPLKDAQGNAVPLARLFPGSNTLNLRPQINFGFPSGFNAQSSGQTIPNAPSYGFDSRWPFDGTDQVQTVSSNLTWVKGAHNVKAGVYLEKMARNVSVYSDLQHRRLLLLRLRHLERRGHGLSFLQPADRRLLRLRRGQPEAGQPRAVHAGGLVSSRTPGRWRPG